jgi:3-hydroxypropanoate dehydrogenase
MKSTLDKLALDQLFREARTYNGFDPAPVARETLVALVELAKMGPTSANGSPMRVVFVASKEAKARLLECVAPGNLDKTRSAPVTAIIAHDLKFAEKMVSLFPQVPDMLTSLPEAARDAWILQNGSLQGAYLIMAARALGLDCGPMGGFDKQKVDTAFLEGTTWRSSFLLNLGQGSESSLFPRNPRLTFEEMCTIV